MLRQTLEAQAELCLCAQTEADGFALDLDLKWCVRELGRRCLRGGDRLVADERGILELKRCLDRRSGVGPGVFTGLPLAGEQPEGSRTWASSSPTPTSSRPIASG